MKSIKNLTLWTNWLRTFYCLVFLLGGYCAMAQTCPPTGTIWYVNASASPGGTGSSWGCAFQNLQDAINAASSGHEIWVAAATYKPAAYPNTCGSCSSNRDFTFHLKDGVALYGGFDGSEIARSERDPAANITKLSGDIGTPGDKSDNAYHVVLSTNDGSATVLDGFTIEHGNADILYGWLVEGNPHSRDLGGGIIATFSQATINNCVFSNNSASFGAGLYGGQSSLTVSNCTFSDNRAFHGGGILLDGNSTPLLTGCTFSNNYAFGAGGGARFPSAACTPTLVLCNFLGNTSNNDGGGISCKTNAVLTSCTFQGNGAFLGGGVLAESASPTFKNCLFSGNAADKGSALANFYNVSSQLTNCTFSGNRTGSNYGTIYNQNSAPILTNCLIWNNRAYGATGSADANLFNNNSTPVITYSLIQNHNPSGAGNLNGITNAGLSNYTDFVTPLDPSIAPSTVGDFHIGACSPAINKGTNTGAPTDDFFGNARPFGGTVDMGIHELQSASTVPTAICRNASVTLNANGTATLAAASVNNNSTGCLPHTLSVSPNAFNCSHLGTPQMVTLTITDLNNLSSACNATVTVNDAQAPTITCPASQTKGTDAGLCTAVVTYASPTSSDNCGGVTLSRTGGPASGQPFPKGMTTVAWKATDAAGLTKTCTFRVTVNDTQAPAFTLCPSSQSLNTDPNLCSAVATYSTPTASDNCAPPPTVVKTSGLASGSAFPKGTSTVVWKAVDGVGLTKTCSFTVTVTDAQLPTINCPANIAVTGSGSPCAATVAYATPTATDNCAVQSMYLLSGFASGSSFPAGTTSVVWRAVDNSGGSATCAFTVTVGCQTSGLSQPPRWGGATTSLTASRSAVPSPPLRGGWEGPSFRLSLSPNPATTEVTIAVEGLGMSNDQEGMSHAQASGGELTVLDAQGRVMWRQQLSNPTTHLSAEASAKAEQLSVADFSAGVYFVTLRSEGQTVTKRLVVQRL